MLLPTKYDNYIKLSKNTFHRTIDYPYHNFRHCLETAERSYDAELFYQFDESIINDLVIAALFHDAAYLGSKDDSENTANSINFLPEYNINQRELILSTTMPWKEPSRKELLYMPKTVLHEADILQTCKKEWIERLGEETGMVASNDFVVQNIKTVWAKAYFNKNIEY